MRTVATHSLSRDASPKKLSISPLRIQKNATPAMGSSMLQRKSNCACGGGCPRCHEQALRPTQLHKNALEDQPDGNVMHNNAAEDAEETEAMEDPSTTEPSPEISDNLLATSFDETLPTGEGKLPFGVEPLDTKAKGKATCPNKTVVEKTIDMTNEGIKKGYRTGYGITAVMRVEPTGTNWDGTKIIESWKPPTKNTCPAEFKISPCSGSDTFTVGAEQHSSILGKLDAKQNHFYDFHTSRWNQGSLLHDRNPNNVDSCQIDCEQEYSCGSAVIGKHTVSRTFTKGRSGTRDVTLVTVSKK